MKIRQGFVSNSSSSSYIVSNSNVNNLDEDECWEVFSNSFRNTKDKDYWTEEEILENLKEYEDYVFELIRKNRICVYYCGRYDDNILDNTEVMDKLGITSKFVSK